jgi:hypothetical protein
MKLSQSDCSFSDDEASSSVPSTCIAVAVSIVLSGAVSCICYFTRKLSWNKAFPPLEQASSISSGDCYVYVILFIEALQTLALAPQLSVIDTRLAQTLAVFTVDLSTLITPQHNDYFFKLYLVLCLTVVWAVSSTWLFFKLREGRKDLNKVETAVIQFSHIMSHIAVLPVLSACVESYVCDLEVDDSTYLRQDCTQICWEARHATFVALALLCVGVYSYLAVLQAPLMQETMRDVHVFEQPGSSMLRHSVLFFLISLKRSMEDAEGLGYSVVYLTTIAVWGRYSFKHKPYNYLRPNSWILASHIVAFWGGFLVFIAQCTSPGVHLNVLLGIGWGLVLSFTWHRQHYHLPSLLHCRALCWLDAGDDTRQLESAKQSRVEVSGLISKRNAKIVDIVKAEHAGEVLCPSNSLILTEATDKKP